MRQRWITFTGMNFLPDGLYGFLLRTGKVWGYDPNVSCPRAGVIRMGAITFVPRGMTVDLGGITHETVHMAEACQRAFGHAALAQRRVAGPAEETRARLVDTAVVLITDALVDEGYTLVPGHLVHKEKA